MTKPASSSSKRQRFEKPTRLNSGLGIRKILIGSLIIVGGVVSWLSFSNPHPVDSGTTDAREAEPRTVGFRTNEQLHAEVKQAFTEGNYVKGAELGRTLMSR